MRPKIQNLEHRNAHFNEKIKHKVKTNILLQCNNCLSAENHLKVVANRKQLECAKSLNVILIFLYQCLLFEILENVVKHVCYTKKFFEKIFST